MALTFDNAEMKALYTRLDEGKPYEHLPKKRVVARQRIEDLKILREVGLSLEDSCVLS